MSLPLGAYMSDTTPLGRARVEATRIVEEWCDGDARVRAVVGGWTAVTLCEEITRAILRARGYDLDELTTALDDAPVGATEADVVAAWERERSRS